MKPPPPSCHNKDLDTRVVLHEYKATAVGYKRMIVKGRDTDQRNRCVYIVIVSFWELQLYFSTEVWMPLGTAKVLMLNIYPSQYFRTF